MTYTREQIEEVAKFHAERPVHTGADREAGAMMRQLLAEVDALKVLCDVRKGLIEHWQRIYDKLEAENARLKAPLSAEEHTEACSIAVWAGIEGAFRNLIALRSTGDAAERVEGIRSTTKSLTMLSRVHEVIDNEIEFLTRHGVKEQYSVMSAEERINCLRNIREKIASLHADTLEDED